MATAIEVLGIVLFLFFSIEFLGMIGAIAAALSIVIGRLLANCYLFVPCLRLLKRLETPVPNFVTI
jgi:hypothetical protein